MAVPETEPTIVYFSRLLPLLLTVCSLSLSLTLFFRIPKYIYDVVQDMHVQNTSVNRCELEIIENERAMENSFFLMVFLSTFNFLVTFESIEV